MHVHKRKLSTAPGLTSLMPLALFPTPYLLHYLIFYALSLNQSPTETQSYINCFYSQLPASVIMSSWASATYSLSCWVFQGYHLSSHNSILSILISSPLLYPTLNMATVLKAYHHSPFYNTCLCYF